MTTAVACAVVLGGAPTAIAFAMDGQPVAPVSTVRPVATLRPLVTRSAGPVAAVTSVVARRSTAVHNWGATARTVGAGKALRVHVRVAGGTRAVRLERHLHGRWVAVDHGTTSAAGRITLHWHAPKTAKRAVLRLHVLHTATFRAAISSHRAVTVRAAASSPAPSSSPSSTSGSPSPSPSSSAPSTSAAETLRAQLFTLVNQARATARTCGGTSYPAVAPLRRSTALDTAAGDYAARMATEDFFSHTAPDGSTMVSRLQAVGITNTTERENIAAGQTSAASVMTAWLDSPGHCANLMAGDVTRIGLGHAVGSGSTYGQYWVQDFAG